MTPAMLERARARGVHDRLVEGDVRDTGLPGAAYDLVVCVLVDEHLPRSPGSTRRRDGCSAAPDGSWSSGSIPTS